MNKLFCNLFRKCFHVCFMVNSNNGLYINSFSYYTIDRIPDIDLIMKKKKEQIGEDVTILSCTRTIYNYDKELKDRINKWPSKNI